MTVEGVLHAKVKDEFVELKMPEVSGVSAEGDNYFVNTGSPHYVQFVDDIEYGLDEEGNIVINDLPQGEHYIEIFYQTQDEQGNMQQEKEQRQEQSYYHMLSRNYLQMYLTLYL